MTHIGSKNDPPKVQYIQAKHKNLSQQIQLAQVAYLCYNLHGRW